MFTGLKAPFRLMLVSFGPFVKRKALWFWTVDQGCVPTAWSLQREFRKRLSFPRTACCVAPSHSCETGTQCAHCAAVFLSSRSCSWIEEELICFILAKCFRREQAVEKKYPGTYKRHPVRPIIHPNTVEKLMKKKGVSHKPGSQTKR